MRLFQNYDFLSRNFFLNEADCSERNYCFTSRK